MQQLIAPNMEYPSILELGKVFTSGINRKFD